MNVKDELNRLRRELTRRESAKSRQSALRSASWLEDARVRAVDFDAHPMLLNVLNGTLDLDACRLREHRRDDLLTQCVPFVYDPAAECPRFRTFLGEVVPDEDVRGFLRRAFGYSLTGLVQEQALFFLWGDGCNGKSTLLGVMQRVLGTDYAATGSRNLLVDRGKEEHPTEIAGLEGKRLVVCSEMGRSAALHEEKVKFLTGGDRLVGRRMRQDFFDFEPVHKIWAQANDRPRIHGTDEGIWRRILLVPFEHHVQRADKSLGTKLLEEAAGILTWAVEGLREYHRIGLSTPERVLAASQSYRASQDQVGRFLMECTRRNPEGRVQARGLFARYQRWCSAGGETAMTAAAFGCDISKRGFEKRKSSSNLYIGLELL